MTRLVAGQDLDALRTWINGWPALATQGIELTHVEAGLVRATCDAAPRLGNPSGAVNGGVLAYFVDQLGGSVSSTLVAADRGPVTATLTLHYLRPAIGPGLVGEGRVVRAGRSVAFVEMTVRDTRGEVAVTGAGTWVLTPPRWADTR